MLPVPAPVKRPYVSPARAARAEATRQQVLASARECFLAAGDGPSTVTAIARSAGVSPDTVFRLFGSKRDLLKVLVDTEAGGDSAEVALLDRPDPQALRRETDPRRQVAMLAAGIRGQLERLAPVDGLLRSAAAVDPEVAALRDDLQLNQRRQAMLTVAGWIAARGPLRDDTDHGARLRPRCGR